MGIVTSGLVAYYHYSQGFGNSKWLNIAPNNSGLYDATMTGGTLQANGVVLDDVDDKIVATLPYLSSPTVEFVFYASSKQLTSGKNSNLMIAPLNSFSISNNILFDDYSDYDYSITSLTNNLGMVLNNLYTLAITYTPKNYLNGVEKTYTSVANSYYISGITTFLRQAGVTVVGIRVYNRPLTLAETQQNAANGASIGMGPIGIVGATKFDSKQYAYKTNLLDYNLEQYLYQTLSQSIDSKQSIFEINSTIFDSIQVAYQVSNIVYDTVQQMINAGTFGLVSFDVRLELCETNQSQMDTKQIIFDPNTQFIGAVKLKGNRQLNIYLVGKQVSNINLKGLI